jgi:hypothetical protein
LIPVIFKSKKEDEFNMYLDKYNNKKPQNGLTIKDTVNLLLKVTEQLSKKSINITKTTINSNYDFDDELNEYISIWEDPIKKKRIERFLGLNPQDILNIEGSILVPEKKVTIEVLLKHLIQYDDKPLLFAVANGEITPSNRFFLQLKKEPSNYEKYILYKNNHEFDVLKKEISPYKSKYKDPFIKKLKKEYKECKSSNCEIGSKQRSIKRLSEVEYIKTRLEIIKRNK